MTCGIRRVVYGAVLCVLGTFVSDAGDVWVEQGDDITGTVIVGGDYHLLEDPVNSGPYTLTYSAGAGGTIEGESPQTVDAGADGTPVEARPDAGAVFDCWSDGVMTAARIDSNVLADINVTAGFKSDAGSGGDGTPITWLSTHGLTPESMPRPAPSQVYWTEFYGYQERGVSRCDLDGGSPELIDTVYQGFRGVAIDPDQRKMYLAAPTQKRIERADLNGGNREVIITNVHPVDVTLDNSAGKIYWTDYTWPNAVIKRADLDGTNMETLTPHLGNGCQLEGIALDVAGGKVYWVERMAKRIRRANLDGSALEIVLTCADRAGNSYGIVVHDGRIYWSDWLTHAIHKADLDGENVVAGVVTNLNGPKGLAIDRTAETLYWVSDGDRAIQRAGIDGTGFETILTDVDDPYGIALDYDPGTGASGPTWATVDTVDSDGDGILNGQEYLADTDPTNAQSVLRLRGLTPTGEGVRIDWQGGVQVRQILERTDDLTPPAAWIPVWTNPPPTGSDTNWLDTNVTGGDWYYRIRGERD